MKNQKIKLKKSWFRNWTIAFKSIFSHFFSMIVKVGGFMRSVFSQEYARAKYFQLRSQKHANNRRKPNPNPKWWKNYPLSILANTFHGCHFKTSNQIEIGAIDHIFQSYLVRSAEVATIKSVWKNLQNFQKKLNILGVSLSCFWVKNMKNNHSPSHNFTFYQYFIP